MLSNLPRTVLQTKIMELQQALFFNDGHAVLRFPISIINALQVDEVDQVWFMVNRPSQHLSAFEKEFRARLDFYKKGKGYYMHVKGKACLVTDPEEINNVHGLDERQKQETATSMVLVRMKISEAKYYPLQRPEVRFRFKPEFGKINLHTSALVKGLQYVIKDVIPVFQSH